MTVTKAYQVYHKTFEAKEKHYEELISRCITQADKNRFYWDMLGLLLDDKEKEIIRKIYYQYDRDFMKEDKKRIYNERIRNSLWRRAWRRISKLIKI